MNPEPKQRVLREFLDPVLTWSCGFSERPTDPACMVPAVWHGIIDDPQVAEALRSGERLTLMACCGGHLTEMSRSADYVHEMGAACGLPGSFFDPVENECFVPDEDGLHALLGRQALPVPAGGGQQ